jgi:hypothetical protein
MKEKSYLDETSVLSMEAFKVVGNVYGFCICLTKSFPIIRSQLMFRILVVLVVEMSVRKRSCDCIYGYQLAGLRIQLNQTLLMLGRGIRVWILGLVLSSAGKEVSFSSTLLVNSVAKKPFSQKYTNSRSLFSVLKELGMEGVKPSLY